MSREIKFRVWDHHKDKMYDWEYISTNWVMSTLSSDRDTVMQFTGLKDKAGREIYEGDLCRYFSTGRIFQVWWDKEYARWAATFINDERQPGIDGLYRYENEASEIVGNIHEHPELIKSEGR